MGGTPSQVWVEVPQGTPYTPWPGLDKVPPSLDWMGYPQPGVDRVPPLARAVWGTPIRQSSIASTCYVAGGMPLAFSFLLPASQRWGKVLFSQVCVCSHFGMVPLSN